MHRAPPTGYPANQTQVALIPVSIVWALGLSVFVFWVGSNQVSATSAAVAGGLVLAAGVVALRSVAATSPTLLQWDGKVWTWSPDGPGDAGEMLCVLDLQRMLLLRLRAGDGRPCWFWVIRSGPGVPWDSFRRAVVDATRPA